MRSYETLDQAFQRLIAEMDTHMVCSAALKIALRNRVQLVHYAKGIKIQHYRQRPDELWFMIAGTAKESAITQESLEKWTTWFWYTNDFLFTEPGMFHLTEADEEIELIEDCSQS